MGGVEEEVERTTPEAIDLQATFRRMLDAGDTAVAMEVSSHAIELGRVSGIRFAVKLFTNLTQDHLDFHGTMDAYYAAKRRLFDEPGIAVVNTDDEYGRRIAAEVGAVTFGIESDADYHAREIDFDFAGSHFLLDTPDGTIEVESPLPGLFNVLNVTGAIAAVRSLGSRARSRSRASSACRAASSRWTRARTSACSWTTRTRPTRSRTCCARRASSRAAGCTWCSARAATATPASARSWAPPRASTPTACS